ncbi:hypothetical protein M0813_12944 [Anaeramoeba flamelloides]|uniref:ABC3 transporter permease C-terminal domain-containing protein n=1 Tax=Anaeramoeba flamelloides TaxID=1746091 RepID=A0ABQ8Z9G3_9EUKA|nr:hypothetical protein M0813_12944 [Anaeramoeba flamelloides]
MEEKKTKTNFPLYFTFTRKMITQQKLNFCLGFFSIFLVVVICSISMTLLYHSSTIFLRIAERQVGEIDSKISSNNYSPKTQINMTAISDLVPLDKLITKTENKINKDKGKEKDKFSFHKLRNSIVKDYIKEKTKAYLKKSPQQRRDIQLNPKAKQNKDQKPKTDQKLKTDQQKKATNDEETNFDNLQYGSPRVMSWDSKLYPKKYCSGDLTNNNWTYVGQEEGDSCKNHTTTDTKNCLDKYCTRSKKIVVHMIESEREEEMGLGRLYKEDAMAAGEINCQEQVFNELMVGEGSDVILRIPLSNAIPSILQEAYLQWKKITYEEAQDLDRIEIPLEWSILNLPFKLTKKLEGTMGKFAQRDVNNQCLLEFSTFLPYLLNYGNPESDPEFMSALSGIDLKEFTDIILWNLEPPRNDYYRKNDYDHVQKLIIDFISKLLYRIGFDQISVNLPILRNMRFYSNFSMFLGIILNVILAILVILSIVLIYSLLLVSIETRTFQMAVFRTIGMSKAGLIKLILSQALAFSLPSWALGLLFGQILYLQISSYFGNILGTEIPKMLSGSSIGVATLIGFAIPIFASIYPIKLALEKSLYSSLDMKRSRIKAVKYKLNRNSQNRFSGWMIVIGLSFAIFGFLIYYLFPLALLSFNLSLLLYIFFSLLLCMLFGLVLLALNIEYPLEKLLSYVFLFASSVSTRFLILKNLMAHRTRNRKTSAMYSLSLAFIIFASVQFDLQIVQITYSIRQENGVLMHIGFSYDDNYNFEKYKFPDLSNIFDYLQNEKNIEDYSWVSVALSDIMSPDYEYRLSNTGNTFSYKTDITTVSPNFLNVTLKDEFWKTKTDIPEFSKLWDPVEQLYTVRGSSSALIGSLYEKSLNLDTDGLFTLNAESKNELIRYIFQPLAFVDSSPIFAFSNLPSTTYQDTIVSSATFLDLSQNRIKSINQIPLSNILLKFTGNIASGDKDQIKDDLDSLIKQFENDIEDTEIDGLIGLSVWDYDEEIEPFDTARVIMTAFSSFAIIVSNIICFFALISSTYVNIYESTKEIGILRAIGLNRKHLANVFIGEALLLVLAASIMGFFIGLIVSYSMFKENQLFLGFEVPFPFPYVIFIVVILSSFVSALLASIFPSKRMLSKTIVKLFRSDD